MTAVVIGDQCCVNLAHVMMFNVETCSFTKKAYLVAHLTTPGTRVRMWCLDEPAHQFSLFLSSLPYLMKNGGMVNLQVIFADWAPQVVSVEVQDGTGGTRYLGTPGPAWSSDAAPEDESR